MAAWNCPVALDRGGRTVTYSLIPDHADRPLCGMCQASGWMDGSTDILMHELLLLSGWWITVFIILDV